MFFLLLSSSLSRMPRRMLFGTATANPWVNIRDRPSINGQIIGKIPVGEKCEILDSGIETHKYIHVHYNGIRGYVYSSKIGFAVANGNKGSEIYDIAYSKKGCKYLYGAAGPNRFDSSGLVYWAHRQCGIFNIPRLLSDQAKGGKQGTGEKGDVVCFGKPTMIFDIGLCDGNGNFLHSPHIGDVVKVSSLANKTNIASIRRYW